MAKRKGRLKQGTNPKAKPRGDVTLAEPKGDMGARGPANLARISSIVEAVEPEVDPDTQEVKRRNPNGVKRRQFYDMLEVYHRRGLVTDRGREAGKKLRAAWETTQKGMGNDWTKPQVDSTPKADAATAVMVDRVSNLVGITKRIPPGDYGILINVACDGHAIGRMREYRGYNHDKGKAHLREALDRLAERIGC